MCFQRATNLLRATNSLRAADRHLARAPARRLWFALVLAAAGGVGAEFFGGTARGAEPAATDSASAGELIYKRLCASCHGADGQGTTDNPKPLIGDKSIIELSKVIDETMPEDEPEQCVGEEAKLVAAYIHDAFYSPVARARNKPARVELARLTARQHQNALADLFGGLRPQPAATNERGLRGEYYRGRRMDPRNRALERVEPVVDFDFGVGGPDGDNIDGAEFSLRFQGALLAPDTGEYELIVRTEHAARLWLNDAKQPLIDAWVKSGSDTEYRASIRLIGGRAYPLKLEYSKAKQGVDDSDKNKPKSGVQSSLRLLWRLPRRHAEIIPQRCLTPQTAPEAYVARTPFPPDDRSVGYERGVSVSKAWDQAVTACALEAADHAAARLDELSAALRLPGERPARARELARRLATAAFRRPLSPAEESLYVDGPLASVGDPEVGLKRAVLLALKSPRFLYLDNRPGGMAAPASASETQPAPPDGYTVAERLSFGLWDSLPDAELLRAAAAGELGTREQARRQAERMLADPRAKSKLREFFLQWLKIEHVPDLAKDAALHADFTPEVVNDLRGSLEIMLDDIVWSEESDFRRLYLADAIPLNGRLARFFGVATPADGLPGDAEFRPMALDGAARAGVLTHPYLLATFAYTSTSSPIHRGVFLTRSVLGRALRPPPAAVAPLVEAAHADLTTRERVALQTQPEACASCHALINPLGFALEHFDAVGRFRAQERDKPIDASGAYITPAGVEHKFTGGRALAEFLAASDETPAAFVGQLFQHLVKQPIRAYGPNQHAELSAAFRERRFHIRQLAAEIVTVAALPGPDTKW